MSELNIEKYNFIPSSLKRMVSFFFGVLSIIYVDRKQIEVCYLTTLSAKKLK